MGGPSTVLIGNCNVIDLSDNGEATWSVKECKETRDGGNAKDDGLRTRGSRYGDYPRDGAKSTDAHNDAVEKAPKSRVVRAQRDSHYRRQE